MFGKNNKKRFPTVVFYPVEQVDFNKKSGMREHPR